MNVTNILIIGAVVLVGIFFVLPMLGSSKSSDTNGSGSLGGGDMPTGNYGAGESKPEDSIYYVPGTGSNTSVAPAFTANEPKNTPTTYTYSKVVTTPSGMPLSTPPSHAYATVNNGSGKSNTQNLVSDFRGSTKGVTYVAEKQADKTTIYRATNVAKKKA